jgi:phosphate transport system substrate-binding protein
MRKQGFYLWAFILLQSVIPTLASAESGSPIVRFSDPDRGIKKPAQWMSAPIKYDKWAKGADIAATLDQHLYPAFLPMVKKYAQDRNLDIAIREGTCGTSEGALNKKNVDIGGFCCPPSTSDRLPGLEFHTMGIASLAILVHPDNPVTNLTTDQVRDIFRGKITNWSQIPPVPGVKALDLPVRAVARLHCKTRPGHWRSILDNEDNFSPSLLEVGTINNMVSAVSEYKGAVGYEVLWNLTRFKQHGSVRAVPINGISPYDGESVGQGKYPFYRVDNITVWTPDDLVNKKAHELVTYLKKRSADVDEVFALVPYEALRKGGWKFKGNELIGEP